MAQVLGMEKDRFLDTVTAWEGRFMCSPSQTKERVTSGLNLESQPEHQPGESALPTHLPKGLLAGGESTPHPRLRLHKGFPSIYLADKHDIIVYVPPCYDRHPERTYPVLYMQDGQNLFDGRTSFIPGRTWQNARARRRGD